MFSRSPHKLCDAKLQHFVRITIQSILVTDNAIVLCWWVVDIDVFPLTTLLLYEHHLHEARLCMETTKNQLSRIIQLLELADIKISGTD